MLAEAETNDAPRSNWSVAAGNRNWREKDRRSGHLQQRIDLVETPLAQHDGGVLSPTVTGRIMDLALRSAAHFMAKLLIEERRLIQWGNGLSAQKCGEVGGSPAIVDVLSGGQNGKSCISTGLNSLALFLNPCVHASCKSSLHTTTLMVWGFIPLPDREPEDAWVPVSDATLSLFSVTSNYPYRPLNPAAETRLLSIKPGSYDDDLFCSLFHAPHASHEDYEALSYVWANAISSWGSKALDVQTKAVIYGEGKENEPVETITFRDLPEHPYYEHLYHGSGGPRRPGHIIIDGVEVAVGGELFTALKRLRSASEPLVLWVDALCINQTDSVERVEHVKEMGGIYARAKSVRIWLGEEVGYEDSAFEALNTIAEKIGDLYRDGVPHDLQRLTFLRDEKIRGLHWDSVSELLGRTWVCVCFVFCGLFSTFC
jgi:hypothetical protein